jgi:hypothetical protein
MGAKRLEYHPLWGLPTLPSPFGDINVTVGAKKLEYHPLWALPTLPSPFGDFNVTRVKNHPKGWLLWARRDLNSIPFGDSRPYHPLSGTSM